MIGNMDPSDIAQHSAPVASQLQLSLVLRVAVEPLHVPVPVLLTVCLVLALLARHDQHPIQIG